MKKERHNQERLPTWLLQYWPTNNGHKKKGSNNLVANGGKNCK